MTDQTVGLRLFGTPTQDTVDRAGPALVRLLDAIAEAKGLTGKVAWELVGWKRACDTCGHTVPFSEELPRGWTNDGTYDHCEACTLEAAR